jgi:LacI family transcriptional regulator
MIFLLQAVMLRAMRRTERRRRVLVVTPTNMGCYRELIQGIIPWREMGRTASLLLDRLMDGEVLPPVLHPVAPMGVAERQSTGGVAIEDEQVRAAVRFIRDHSGSQITVNEVVEQAGTNRRGLERKFRTILGRSPLGEIRRSRVDRARLLLSQSSLTTKQVARQCGFASVTWFTTAFRDITGESPASYRHRVRGV